MPISKSKNKIGITLGDPSGIGPEIVAKALAKSSIRNLAEFTIVGDYKVFKRYSSGLHKNISFIDLDTFPLNKFKEGTLNKFAGRASLLYLEKTIALLKKKEISALVTGPICKEAVGFYDKNFHGHTEYLAQAFKCGDFGMFFISGDNRVILCTRHIPLKGVAVSLNIKTVSSTIKLTAGALKDLFKIRTPRLAVCGLNPHAGEGGRIGREELDVIIPAIKECQGPGLKISGPFAADTIFTKIVSSKYDAIIAMYHDQGLVALKTTNMSRLVNLTIGLPFIRTSPAHGTAFDIAGKNRADPSSMCAAIKLAVNLSKNYPSS